MKVYNIKDLTCFESKLNGIASKLNIKLDYNLISKNCMRVKLVKTKENKNYQRIGFYPNKDGSPRKVNAICWHGFKDFLTNLLDQYPKLRIVTAQIIYNGHDDFMNKFEGTASINIGSMVQPLTYENACLCRTQYFN
tara:strand:+ start:90 stop:500 length:411 start_codon:yes stop_codon:yes gene_type:complete